MKNTLSISSRNTEDFDNAQRLIARARENIAQDPATPLQGGSASILLCALGRSLDATEPDLDPSTRRGQRAIAEAEKEGDHCNCAACGQRLGRRDYWQFFQAGADDVTIEVCDDCTDDFAMEMNTVLDADELSAEIFAALENWIKGENTPEPKP